MLSVFHGNTIINRFPEYFKFDSLGLSLPSKDEM
jgi:hypothetical protein